MRILFDPRSLADLQEIFDFIAKDDPVAAARVVKRIEQSVGRLLTLPYSGRPSQRGDVRILSVPGLPYIVVHRVLDDNIEILAVFHTARDHQE